MGGWVGEGVGGRGGGGCGWGVNAARSPLTSACSGILVSPCWGLGVQGFRVPGFRSLGFTVRFHPDVRSWSRVPLGPLYFSVP